MLKIKLSQEQVEQSFLDKGYMLLSQYKSARELITVKCPKGHIYETRYNDFQQGHGCGHSECAHNIKYTHEYVESFFNKEKYQLCPLSQYKDTNTPMDVICDRGHNWQVSFKRFKNGVRCKYCYGNDLKTQEMIEEYFNKTDYKLLSEYKGANKKLELLCPKGHVYKVKFNNFQQGQRCSHPDCHGGIRYSLERIKEQTEDRGYICLANEYKNALTKIPFKCPDGHIFEMRWNDFQQGQRCPNTSHKLISIPELEVKEYIKTIYSGIVEGPNRKIVYNPWTKYKLELDIYLPELKKAIEYNGPYHYVDMTDTINGFVKQQWRDEMKVKQCSQLGIELLVINGMGWQKEKQNILENVKEFVLSH
jgi:hypothetical protein